MVSLLIGVASAATVVCDEASAVTLLEDARVDERRAPVTHPWLIPGLSRKAASADLRAAIAELCRPGGELAVQRMDQAAGAGWSAHTVVVSRIETQGCSLHHERVAVSVGIGAAVTYRLRGSLPPESTPLAGCAEPPRWRTETVIDGAGQPVRLVLVTDHVGEEVVASSIVVRNANAEGWTEQALIVPAPERLATGSDASGPIVRLSYTRSGEVWVTASRDRRMTDANCVPIPGQTVWRHQGEAWVPLYGREALHLLATEGLWRQAGEPAYLLILAQDDEHDELLVGPRRRRLARRDAEPLHVFPSADFPLLNPGFVVIAPAPWSSREEALGARLNWGRRPVSSIRQVWPTPQICSGDPSE